MCVFVLKHFLGSGIWFLNFASTT